MTVLPTKRRGPRLMPKTRPLLAVNEDERSMRHPQGWCVSLAESVPRLDCEKDPDHADGKCNDAERGCDQKPRWHLRLVVLSFLSHSVLPSAVISGRGSRRRLSRKWSTLPWYLHNYPKGLVITFHTRGVYHCRMRGTRPFTSQKPVALFKGAEPRGSSII